MNSEEFEFSTLHDEFVVIGPVNGRDRVLVRSEKAGLDLIGFALDKDDGDDNSSDTFGIFDLFSSARRSLHRISSWPISTPSSNIDERKSSYRFSWVGLCSRRDLESIKKSFNANIIELTQAASQADRQAMEMAIAPVLYKCAMADERSKRRRRIYYSVFIIYLMIFILSIAALSSKSLLEILAEFKRL